MASVGYVDVEESNCSCYHVKTWGSGAIQLGLNPHLYHLLAV